MKFFMPSTESDKHAESIYAQVADFIGCEIRPKNERVYSIKYSHNGIKMTATVGENIDDYYRINNGIVHAIFEGNPCKICLENHGVLGNNPIFVGKVDVYSIMKFKE